MAFSVQLAGVLLILFVVNLNFINKRKYAEAVSLAFALLLFVPVDAMGLLSGYPYSSGGKLNISLVGYDVLLMWICLILLKKNKLKSGRQLSVIVGCLVFMFIIRMIVDTSGAFSNKLMDNYMLPILLAAYIICFLPPKSFPKVMKSIFVCILINAFIGVVEVLIGRSLLFHEYYLRTNAWYQGLYGAQTWGIPMRSTALLGHPLINGIYCVLAFPYLIYSTFEKRKIVKVILFTLLFLGVLASNSRGALLVLCGFIAYSVLRRKEYGKAAVIILVTFVFIGTVDLNDLYNSMFSRDVAGTSIEHRFLALEIFTKIPFKTLVLGTGYNNSGTTLREIGFQGNFEIAYLIILLENGVVGFGAWVASILTLYRCNIVERIGGMNCRAIINGMLICILGIAFTGNYFGDPGTLNYMLWSIFSFSFLMRESRQNKLQDR